MDFLDFLTAGSIGIVIVCLVLFFIVFGLLKRSWVKAPPDIAFIISGWKKTPRTLLGRGGFCIPFIERVDKLYLGQITVDIETRQSVPTNDFINVRADAVAKVAVGDEEEDRLTAAKNFLNLNAHGIAEQLCDSLEGNIREIIGTLTLKEISTSRDAFSEQVKKAAAEDMKRLGIKVISFNIQSITDDNGLINDLGADNTAKIRKDASIAKALADRDVAVEQAKAQKEANDARVKADLEIAQRQNELAIRKAELKKQSDVKKAEADAAYAIQEQEQRKTIEIATVNANIAKAEREADLKKTEVAVKEQELAAQIQKQADADKYKTEQNAKAELARRQREAESQLYEQQKQADARKAQAEAEKYAMEQQAAGIAARAQAEADAIRLKGEAEARAVQAKGEAEAVAMDKKAEAMKKYGQAAMAQMMIEVLPQVAAEVARPLSRIDKMTIFAGDGNSSIGSAVGNVPVVMAKTFQSVKEATGVDLMEIMKGQSGAETKQNVNITGETDTNVDVAVGK